MTRSPTFARVFLASSGESGFGPAEALAEAEATGASFFLEHPTLAAEPPITATRASARPRPPTPRLPKSASDIAPGILRAGAPVEPTASTRFPASACARQLADSGCSGT